MLLPCLLLTTAAAVLLLTAHPACVHLWVVEETMHSLSLLRRTAPTLCSYEQVQDRTDQAPKDRTSYAGLCALLCCHSTHSDRYRKPGSAGSSCQPDVAIHDPCNKET